MHGLSPSVTADLEASLCVTPLQELCLLCHPEQASTCLPSPFNLLPTLMRFLRSQFQCELFSEDFLGPREASALLSMLHHTFMG